MENPFYRNRKWYEQPDLPLRTFSRSPSCRSIPAHPIQRPPAPKVVQIPVRFVGSETVDRSGSALRIQKVFRGFLVRKNMKRIKDVKMQVNEIEQKLLKSDVVGLISSNEKERLRMSESLMYLLFKLDSVRGVDLRVRDCRKAVTRKVIALQEKIDSIIAVNFDKEHEPEVRASEETDRSDQLEDYNDKYEEFVEMMDESGEELESMDKDQEIENIVDVRVDWEVKVREENHAKEESLMENDGKDNEDDWIDVQGDVEVKERHGDDGNERNTELMDRMMKDNEKMMNMMTQLFDSNEKQMKMLSALAHRIDVQGDVEVKERHGDDGNERNTELMDRMMKDNEKMMNMMTQLFDSNEKQMKMLSALAHRVEMLEKAFLCNNLRKMKSKKKKSGGKE